MASPSSWPVLVPYAPSVLRRRLPWALGRPKVATPQAICRQPSMKKMSSAVRNIKSFAVAFTVALGAALASSNGLAREGLACNPDGSGPEINACAIERLNSAEKALNSALASLIKRATPENKSKLQSEHSKWLESRDAECKELLKEDEGYSIWPSEFNDCLSDLTLKRVKELRATNQPASMQPK
jgi:uncharacterized protein YecT (DUF1311 family)